VLQKMRKMNKLTLFFFALLISGCANNEWKEYVYDEFYFSAEFPTEPVVDIKNVDSEFNHYTIISIPNKTRSEFTSYSVVFVDLNKNFDSNNTSSVADYFLTVDDQIKALKPHKLIDKRQYQLDDYPAVEYVMEFADGIQTMIYRYLLVEDKSLQFLIICPTISKENPDRKRFLDSFTILKDNS